MEKPPRERWVSSKAGETEAEQVARVPENQPGHELQSRVRKAGTKEHLRHKLLITQLATRANAQAGCPGMRSRSPGSYHSGGSAPGRVRWGSSLHLAVSEPPGLTALPGYEATAARRLVPLLFVHLQKM